ncbi:sensor domain-containing protein, partial [Mycobacterium sp.]|uniref:sensor domain-containing protein n=1 Tax=Mycobacterium sp. TaxID=1785 RepID=UPI0025CFBFE7
MRHWTVAVAVAAVAALVASCGGHNASGPGPTTTTTTTTKPPPPVAQAALGGILLTPAEIDGLLGLTGTKSKEKVDKLVDDNAKQQWPAGWKFPDECLYALNPAEAPVYADSGFTAVSGDDDVASLPPGSSEPDPELTQAVVLFPSANEANAFFAASAQKWPACNNRQFTTPGGPDNPELAWKVGTTANTNGILTTTISVTMNVTPPPANGAGSSTVSCQRALTVRNNVAIDVSGCRQDPGDLGVKAANQIAGKADSANANFLAGSVSKGYGLNNCRPAPAAKLTGQVLAGLDCGQNPDPGGPV